MQPTFGQTNQSKKPQPGAHQTNPFARALAETEQATSNQQPAPLTNPFSEALARTGGSFQDNQQQSPFDQQAQMKQLEDQRKKEALRRKLHDQVNQVNREQAIFNAREDQVRKEIEKLREELALLAKDVNKFNKEIEISIMSEVVDPGQQGKYYLNFFQQLRAFIMLLRQKIRSARTWSSQFSAKKKKKSKKPGMEIGGAQHEKTSTVYDMMHHERSSQYSGG